MNPAAGFVLAVACGAVAGAFSLPMKRTRHWAWENTWLAWAFVALLFLPWGVASATVPRLLGVLVHSGAGALGMAALFGVGWGLGAVMFGQGIALIGMSLAFAISIGLTTALGALVPMLAKPAVFCSPKGMAVTAGVLLMLSGVVLCAWAGKMKEARSGENSKDVGRNVFLKGIVLCVLSGLFNPMINLAFGFGARIKDASMAAGASEMASADALWAVTLLGGLAANCVYCGSLLYRNRTWGNYLHAGSARNWPLAALMGSLWFGSVAVYGRAAVLMGDLGSSTGWAVYMGCCVLMSNLLGIISGEWANGKGMALRVLFVGQSVLLIAIGAIGFGNAL